MDFDAKSNLLRHLALIVIALVLLTCLPGVAFADNTPRSQAATPWTVFSIPSSSLPMGANLVVNPGFESGSASWFAFGGGYSIDTNNAHSGAQALKLDNTSGQAHGAGQTIMLNQATPKPVYFSGWSRAVSTSGYADDDYSFYLDIVYNDDTNLYGQLLRFDPANANWHFREGFITPAKPIKTIYAYVLFRNNHAGHGLVR